jgi:hypothetical protein
MNEAEFKRHLKDLVRAVITIPNSTTGIGLKMERPNPVLNVRRPGNLPRRNKDCVVDCDFGAGWQMSIRSIARRRLNSS